MGIVLMEGFSKSFSKNLTVFKSLLTPREKNPSSLSLCALLLGPEGVALPRELGGGRHPLLAGGGGGGGVAPVEAQVAGLVVVVRHPGLGQHLGRHEEKKR